MIHNFLRKLTPYSGYLGGSDSGGGGGGGSSDSSSSSSDTSWADTSWDDSTSAVEAVNDSWGSSSSSDSYSDPGASTVDSFDAEFEAAIAADEALNAAYDAGASEIYSGSSGDITYTSPAEPISVPEVVTPAPEPAPLPASEIVASYTPPAEETSIVGDLFGDFLNPSTAASFVTGSEVQVPLAATTVTGEPLDPYADVKDSSGNFLPGVSIPGVTNTPQTTFTNELGQPYTQAEVDALGTRDAEGNYLIGNVANRVDMGDGQTGYLIGTGNNAVPDSQGGGYSMGGVNYVAEGLLSPTPDYVTPTPEPTAVDRYIPRPDQALLDYYEANIGSKLTDDPNQYVTGWMPGMLTATQIMDEAIASGQGITDFTFGDLELDQRFFDIYTAQNYGVPYNDSVMSKYGTGPEGYNNFIGALEKAKEQGSTWLGGNPDVLIYEGKDLRDPNTGTVIAEDPVSFNGFMASIAQGLGNFVLGQLGGGIAGDLVYSIFGGFKAPLLTAMGVRAGIQGYQPIQAKGYVDESGEAYTVSSFFGQETMAKVSEIKPQEYFESSQGQEVVGTANEIADAVNTGRAKGWRDYYNGSASIEDVITGAIIGNLVAGADSFTGDLINAAKDVIVDGEDPLVAVVRALGDDVTKALPDGFDTLTETAARIMVGENPIQVLGEIYGPEVGIEGPVGIAAVKGAVALDQGKSPEEALAISTYHYFKNGGTLPDFEAPSFLSGAGDFMNVDLGFLADAGQAAIDFIAQYIPNLPEGFSLGDIPEGFANTLQGISDWVASIELPSVDVPSVDLPSVDLPSIDLPSVDLSGLDLALSSLGGGSYSGGSDYVPPNYGPSLIQNPLNNKLLSREILARTFKKA